jgi:hypothetical protein
MNIELHIEELLLHGFEQKDHAAIGNAVRGELERLLTRNGLPEGFGGAEHRATLDGGSFSVAPGAHPGAVGREIARSIYRGMTS